MLIGISRFRFEPSLLSWRFLRREYRNVFFNSYLGAANLPNQIATGKFQHIKGGKHVEN